MQYGNVTLGLSLHRPEFIPLFSDRARTHDVIVLEEPPHPEFEDMLHGRTAIDDYVAQTDTEYPEFGRQMCLLNRRFHADGKKIIQIEPFLETLIGIHEFLAAGHRPGELEQESLRQSVYLCEKRATGALIRYYNTVTGGSFDQTIEAVKRFARTDALRFRLRDQMRSIALEKIVNRSESVYIEAGTIHLWLFRRLRRRMQRPERLKLVFLTDGIVEQMNHTGRLYGPGDRLTLHYIFNPGLRSSRAETLLAARSLVHAKTVLKEEITDNPAAFPHIRDELRSIDMVDRLSLDDCRRLFPRIRRAATGEAGQILSDHLAKKSCTGRKGRHETDQI